MRTNPKSPLSELHKPKLALLGYNCVTFRYDFVSFLFKVLLPQMDRTVQLHFGSTHSPYALFSLTFLSNAALLRLLILCLNFLPSWSSSLPTLCFLGCLMCKEDLWSGLPETWWSGIGQIPLPDFLGIHNPSRNSHATGMFRFRM